MKQVWRIKCICREQGAIRSYGLEGGGMLTKGRLKNLEMKQNEFVMVDRNGNVLGRLHKNMKKHLRAHPRKGEEHNLESLPECKDCT